MLAEGGLQMWQIDQELGILDAHGPAVGIESGTWNQAVDVGMKSDLLVPSVEHGGEAVDVGAQPLVGGQLFGQCAANRFEEQVVNFLGMGAEEQFAQLGRDGEGDQEVRSVDKFSQFTLHPLGGGGAAALGTGLVVAGVIGQVLASALVALKEISAQGRGAAMGDGPDGAALVLAQRRISPEKLWQEPVQRLHDRGRHGWIPELTGQTTAELVHETQRVLGALVGQMKVDHRGGDLFMAEKFLDGVEMRAGFEQMCGK